MSWQGDAQSQSLLKYSWSARDIDNNAIVGHDSLGGTGGLSAFLLEDGTPESYIDLHPSGYHSSFAYAVNGNVQGGSANLVINGPTHAMIWRGTSESYVDLHPTGYRRSEVNGVYGDSQVGFAAAPTSNFDIQAMLWTGTAESAVSLHPSGASRSSAYAITENYQAGIVSFPGPGSAYKAALWYGTAESMVMIHPDGYSSSVIYDASKNFQVGYGLNGSTTHSMIWQGTAESAIDLHSLLPEGYVSSTAYGVDDFGNIVGIAYHQDSPSFGHAVLWSVPEPATLSLLAVGGLALLRKRK